MHSVQHLRSNGHPRLHPIRTSVAGFAIILGVLSSPVFAQTAAMSNMAGMHDHDAASSASDANSASDTPAVKAFKAADQHMMQQMSAGYTGDTDQDFVTHMLPHHEGAVAMAKIQLAYGKDPALKKLAHEIINAQDKEIEFMKRWQAQHPAKQ